MSHSRQFISQPPHTVAGWVAKFDPAQLPVLASTAHALEELRLIEDDVDAHLLAETLGTDPLMMLKLLAHVASLRIGREGSEPETAVEALVMMGIAPFFRVFGPQRTVDEQLAGRPEAQAGFEQVLLRSHRAANFAIGFAVHRMDHDAAVLHEAALLHDFAELLLWLYAPAMAEEIRRRQHSNADLRSAQVQREVLHIELADLQHALMQTWRLPSLLVKITDDHALQPNAQVRNVLLAIRVARHSAQGWDNAALPDDLREIGELLQLSAGPTARLLQDIENA